jgi:hypothetical protein
MVKRMLRVVLAAVILLVGATLLAKLTERDSWAQFVGFFVVLFAVSAPLPHYFYRGEPLLPDRHRRRHGENGAPTA